MKSEYSKELSLKDVNDEVLSATKPPIPLFYFVVAFLALVVVWGLFSWIYQVRRGMGVAGLNHPVGWGVYIANFVFWVGIAHSGTLISAILFLVRAKFRDAVSRSAEAMTIFAVMTAGLFPLMHLGRLWIFYYIIPYPNERELWPNFLSPLVWDFLAVSTYFTVSLIFWYVGMIPDLASGRDRFTKLLGPNHIKTRIYRAMSLGWSGSEKEWRHYGRSYLFFAALATPLVISVHSVVSWDFAMGLLPGWHETIFAPYFVAGAIHSGLAMVLTLLIPLRKILKLEKLMTIKAFDMVARTMIVTGMILGYTYVIEPALSAYTGNPFETQFTIWQRTGWISWIYYIILICNFFVPMLFIFRKFRRSFLWLFVISIVVNIGMWLERVFIVIGSTAHDFLPHNWGKYSPSWVEISITAASLAFFLMWFLIFSKTLPTIPMADFKEQLAEDEMPKPEPPPERKVFPKSRQGKTKVMAIFSSPENFINSVKKVYEAGFHVIEAFSPLKIKEVSDILNKPKSPVRKWTLIGAVLGIVCGYTLAIATANTNKLIVGGKPPTAPIPYTIVGFELLILFGTLANLIGMLFHTKLYKKRIHPYYDPRFSQDRFGILISCDDNELDDLREVVLSENAEEFNVRE